MSLAGSTTSGPGTGGPSPGAGLSSGRRGRRRWRRWAAGVLAALIVAAGVGCLVVAGSYQPLQFGGMSGSTFPGRPPIPGARMVNDFGVAEGSLYIPPQRGVFTLSESIYNPGPWAVTIEAVTVQQRAPGENWWPLVPAGPVLQLTEYGRQTPAGGPAAGASLAPHQGFLLGIPVRFAHHGCSLGYGWTGLDHFYVKERFLTFTRWVSIPLDIPLTMNEPESLSVGGVVCPK